MQRLKYFILIVFALVMTGCGQQVVETLNVPNAPGPDAPGSGSTIVILPFADYTYSDDLASAYRRNQKVTESLTDNLSAQGFAMPVAEDIFSFLVGQGHINVANYDNKSSESLSNELDGDWSEPMKDSIRHYIGKQRAASKRDEAGNAPGTHALDTNAITKIGREFQADYVVRGRILEFKTRQDPTWAVWRKGLFPVVIGGTAQMLYGFAGSDAYDTVNTFAMTGGLIALGIGSATDWPMGESKIFSDGITKNEVIWAGLGGGLGDQSARTGKVDQAVVQLRIYVQDATTGQVVWTNRAMVRVSPESIFSDDQFDDLFNTAIEKGVSTLVDDFVTRTL